MSDDSEVTEVPGPEGTPSEKGLMGRYRDAATWVKVAIPLAIVAVLVGVGVLIATATRDDSSTTTASGDGSSTTADASTDSADSTESTDRNSLLLLVAIASQLASEPTTTTTTTPETTTTAPTTTTAATPVPTTAPAAPSTTPTTVPTTSQPTTTTTTKPTTTSGPTTSTSEVELPPGEVAASPDAFKTAWNAAAPDAGVPTISSWSQAPLAGQTASTADLGGNIRLVLLSDSADGPVAEAVLAWLPLSDASEQEAQNDAYQKAFGVLMEAVNPRVTSAQQTKVAKQLGLSSTAPPFPDGATASGQQGRNQYDLRALIPDGRSGTYTLIGATESS